jgi:hypothetical protein
VALLLEQSVQVAVAKNIRCCPISFREKGSKDDDPGDILSSDEEERDRDSQETNRAKKKEEKNSRKVPSTTVNRSSKTAATTTRSARAESKTTAAANKTKSTALPAPATKQAKAKQAETATSSAVPGKRRNGPSGCMSANTSRKIVTLETEAVVEKRNSYSQTIVAMYAWLLDDRSASHVSAAK